LNHDLMSRSDDMSDVEASPALPLPLWFIAALGAVMFHAGCAALALEYARPDEEEALGAPAIEIGIELLAPRLEPTDLPPGPIAEASAASPPVPEQ
jgi:periplasmic protein TonB